MHRVQQVVNALTPDANPVRSSEVKSIVDHVPVAPPNEIFNTAAMYNKDPDPRKINLGIGAYRDDDGKPYVLKSVRAAEARILNDKSLNHEYLGIAGDQKFIKLARELLFGADCPALKENRIASVQTLSGTGSLSLGAAFLLKFLKGAEVYVPDPTWPNHNQVFAPNGVRKYRYWDPKTRGLNLSGMLADLQAAKEGSVVVLHACAHNPTGVDPTKEQWHEIARVMKAKKLIPYFDIAYQGFATGDLDADAYSVRYFTAQGFELFVSQSFAKNFGLYDTRTGLLSVVCATADCAKAVTSQLEILIRASYSNPPSHGARVVATILSDPELTRLWKQELKEMSGRIMKCRQMLYDELKRLGTPGDWTHIITQIGMFSYTGLTPAQCKVLLEKHHIYLLMSGRISMCGITSKNVAYLAKCIDEVVRTVRN